jgi:hypothetical protein
MTHGITKELVRTVVASLNDKAERLGWVRRYEVEFGSNPNGIKHVLQTRVPDMGHPTDQHPFATLSQVHKYLQAMGQVLNDAIAERDRARQHAVSRGIAIVTGEPLDEVLARRAAARTYDPDARTERRALEDQADFYSRPAGADQ